MKFMFFVLPTLPATLAERKSMRPNAMHPERWQAMIEEVVELAQLAEEVGFDGFCFPEHHLHSEGMEMGSLPVLTQHVIHNTKRIKVGPIGYVLPGAIGHRDPDGTARRLSRASGAGGRPPQCEALTRSAAAAQQVPLRRARAAAVLEGDLAVDHHRVVALRALHAAPFTARKIVRDFHRQNLEPLQIVNDHVGRRALDQRAAILESSTHRGMRAHAEMRLFQRDHRILAHDFPGGEWRRVQRAEGYHTVMVNGEVAFEDGRCTGATSGKLLRRGG